MNAFILREDKMINLKNTSIIDNLVTSNSEGVIKCIVFNISGNNKDNQPVLLTMKINKDCPELCGILYIPVLVRVNGLKSHCLFSDYRHLKNVFRAERITKKMC